VHDIGKNLVDIILSNNGYTVYNLGIKVPAETIIEKARAIGADLIGLSGLLVKSAIVMKESLPQYKAAGLTCPILLGGAALTRKYVAESCVPAYGGPVVYCSDAFAGLKAAREFEEGRLRSTVYEPAATAPSLKPGPKNVEISREHLLKRQLWHWACALLNVYDIDFNDMPALATPDKSNWFGCWSNDSAEALRALTWTNQKALVRKCLIHYVRVAINANGDLTWYLHGTGVSAFGNPRDLGRLSHGVPALITALAEYVKTTNDLSILSEPAGDGQTVWEKVRNYLRQVFPHRDLDGDGLVEWRQLWEGGADDKVGPFFSSADIGQWVKAIETMSPEDFQKFQESHVRPVVNLYEQHFFLYALDALVWLADKNNDPETAKLARSHMEKIVSVLHSRHWDEKDGFYYDWDVNAGALSKIKNQDAFYILRFLPDRDRATKMVRYLDDPNAFGLKYLPTLARNEPGFKADGYWCGGYWPREAASMAWGLAAIGEKKRAEEMLVKALCSADGKIVLENVNPITGKPSTPIVMMAYGSLLNVALHEIHSAKEVECHLNPER